MTMRITLELVKQLLTQVTTADLEEDGILVGAKIGLITNTNELGDKPLYADLDQPTFTGYAVSAAVAYGAPFIDEEQTYHVSTDLKQFQCSGGTPDESVTGAFLYTGAPASEKVLAYEIFDTPVAIEAVGDGLRYAGTLRLPFGADYGSGLLLS